jgi:hypothetical protein
MEPFRGMSEQEISSPTFKFPAEKYDDMAGRYAGDQHVGSINHLKRTLNIHADVLDHLDSKLTEIMNRLKK